MTGHVGLFFIKGLRKHLYATSRPPWHNNKTVLFYNMTFSFQDLALQCKDLFFLTCRHLYNIIEFVATSFYQAK